MMAAKAGWHVDETWRIDEPLVTWARDVTPESVHDFINRNQIMESSVMVRMVPGAAL
jgi:hypothetical protein